MDKTEIAELLELKDQLKQEIEIAKKAGQSAMKAATRAQTAANRWDDQTLSDLKDRVQDMNKIFSRNLVALTTIEMVIYTLWKTDVAHHVTAKTAVNLVRLLGHGADYYYERREWPLLRWIQHLNTLTEADMPK